MTVAAVTLWGSRIGGVAQDDARDAAVFQYDPRFVRSGIQISPLTMPLRLEPYTFRGLGFDTFKGLPGLLADSLPDRYGNALIDAWLAQQGRSADSFNAVERLCYIGRRGMGALEFTPTLDRRIEPARGFRSTLWSSWPRRFSRTARISPPRSPKPRRRQQCETS